MILTITFNAALDRVIFVDEILPGATAFAQKMVDSVGGKGYDTSLVLVGLGAPNLALGFAAGEIGKTLQRLIERYGIPHEITWVEGETRINHIFIETRPRRVSRVNTPGYCLTLEDLARFLKVLEPRLEEGDWVVASGSLPRGLPASAYQALTRLAVGRGARVLIDASGEPARQALASPPAVLKMNHHEFADTFGFPVQAAGAGPEGLCTPARAILREYRLPALVLTCGSAGILAVLPDRNLWASTPILEEVNAAGAGDAVSAALAWRFSMGDTWEQALRWAAATSAAVVLTEPTAEFRREDIERIYPMAKVEQI